VVKLPSAVTVIADEVPVTKQCSRDNRVGKPPFQARFLQLVKAHASLLYEPWTTGWPTMIQRRHRFWRRGRGEQAQGLAEYAIILALVAIVVAIVLRGLGSKTSSSMIPVKHTLQ
jgi:Flp pilus assembly pilin Flp